MAVIGAHQILPGKSATAISSWPAAAGFPFDPSRPTLVMLAHPGCPCTLASLRELERIEGESLGHLTAHVIFLDVAGTPEKDSATMALARSIQGVHVHTGAAPSVASIWGAHTSGQVFLYDPRGQLRFSGGITAGRGHEGLNAGHSAIVSFLRTGRLATNQAPVFGCSLLGSL